MRRPRIAAYRLRSEAAPRAGTHRCERITEALELATGRSQRQTTDSD